MAPDIATPGLDVAWNLENTDTIPLLTKGSYGLTMSGDELETLRRAGTLGDLERVLFEIAGRQRDARKGRDQLRAAFTVGGIPQQEQLREIRALVGPLPLMNVGALSSGALVKLHDAIVDALAEDDAAAPGERPHGVRDFADWRICGDLLESEMERRGIAYNPIDW